MKRGIFFRFEVDDAGKIVLVPEERQEKHRKPSVAAGAVEVRRVCAEEGYVFEVPERRNRPNSFSDALADLPR